MELSFIRLIDYIGTFAFAISGLRMAAIKHYDWFGAHKEEDRERERHMIAEEIAATNRLSKKSDKN